MNKKLDNPYLATHPGELIKDELREHGMTQKTLAEKISIKASVLNEIIHGKRPISMNVALALEKGLEIPAEIWIRMLLKGLARKFGWVCLMCCLTIVLFAQEPVGNNQSWQKVDLQRNITHPQPMTGVVLWPYKAKKVNALYGDCIQLEFEYFEPREMVKGLREDGSIIYDWSIFEKTLTEVAGRGHQLIARFFYEYPATPPDIAETVVPQFIKDLPDYEESYSTASGTYYADWSNQALQDFTMDFYRTFIETFGKDIRLAFLQIGFGHWAEYHIYPTKVEYGKNIPSLEFQTEFLLMVDELCGDLPWMVSKNAADNSPIPTDQNLLAMDFGLFEDSFMGEYFLNGGYNKAWNNLSKGMTRWHIGVYGGEIGPGSEERYNFLNPEGMFGHQFEDVAAKYHISYAISNQVVDNPHGTPERVKKASMSIGYRFVVKDCLSDGISTRILVYNDGIAPLYRDAYFAIGDVRSQSTLRGLLPGEEIWIEIDAPASKNGDNIKIVSDFILPQQEIEFEAKLTSTNHLEQINAAKHWSKTSIYNIHGQELPQAQSGFNIINGQKVLWKN